jgi:hypothetical protein
LRTILAAWIFLAMRRAMSGSVAIRSDSPIPTTGVNRDSEPVTCLRYTILACDADPADPPIQLELNGKRT